MFAIGGTGGGIPGADVQPFFITAGDIVPITVMRGNQKLTFSVQATLHPASRSGVLLASPDTPAMNQQAMPLSLGSDVPPMP